MYIIIQLPYTPFECQFTNHHNLEYCVQGPNKKKKLILHLNFTYFLVEPRTIIVMVSMNYHLCQIYLRAQNQILVMYHF